MTADSSSNLQNLELRPPPRERRVGYGDYVEQHRIVAEVEARTTAIDLH